MSGATGLVPGTQASGADRPGRLPRPSRGLLVTILLVVAAIGVIAWVASGNRTGYLQPDAVDPSGSRAIVNVLRANGVSVTTAGLTSEAADSAASATVLITTEAYLTPEMLATVLEVRPTRVVLVNARPGGAAFQRLAAGVPLASDQSGPEVLDPGCTLPAAQRAGSAHLPGPRYNAAAWEGTAQVCYGPVQRTALVVLPAAGARPEVVLLGSAKPLQNDGFAHEGNAALALSLLGSRSHLVWWTPLLGDPVGADSQGTPLSDLLPRWVVPAVVQLGIASLFLAWWRGRRMGPLVREPLPVVIRAGETVAGRARLLRASRARGTAAKHLREAAISRLTRSYRLAPGAPPAVVIGAVADGLRRAPNDVAALLYGPDPTSDRELVALQYELGRLG